ncbi:hypothetical protein [Aurantiacibacter zhengii]|uniref:Uncharacterized protein n=1 Tax=Aurantiacibacter zhengii TaxID=2307003 RepID=A0A418NTZ1_9SPHN|nr:hypothetical protein [Aurantiacibacter zhengii]RIV87471.1 hypothetical protein D2V07_03735 [Aurantiacibacter zhengii]
MTPAHRFFPAVTLAQVRREVARELAQRERVYPGRVSEGRLHQDEADRQLAIARAWLEDIDRVEAIHRTPGKRVEPTHTLPWKARRVGLLRELEWRGKVYPRLIAEGRLAADDAESQNTALRALLAIYEDGFDWISATGARPRIWLTNDRTPAEAEARHEWLQFQLARALDQQLDEWERTVRDEMKVERIHPAAVGGQQELAI